jgi:hypothetical protein
MFAMPDQDHPECASGASVSAHRETKNTCWATGKKEGFIYWERIVLRGGVLYSLDFQYRESLKEAMDPIVAHVNASWVQGPAPHLSP